MKKVLLFLALMFCISSSWAVRFLKSYTANVNGVSRTYSLNFITTSSSTVSITYDSWDDELGIAYNPGYSNPTPITIPETVTYNSTTYTVTEIGPYAFYYIDPDDWYPRESNITSISIPSTVTSIGESAFRGCNNVAITFRGSTSLTYVGDWAFSNCSNFSGYNGNISISSQATYIGASAFWYCSNLTGVVYYNGPRNLRVVGYPFQNSGIHGVHCGEVTTNIPANLFAYCINLETVRIYSWMQRIGSDAFLGCTNLRQVTFGGRDDLPQYWHRIIFENDKANPLYYAHKLRSYYDHDDYEAFSEVYCNTNDPVSDYAYVNCTTVTKIIYQGGTSGIGRNSFSGCTNLREIEVTAPDSPVSTWTTIADGAFSGCTRLKEISFPNSVTTIGSDAFSGCDSLANIILPNAPSLATIGNRAFANCTSLSSITIPNSVTSIGTDAFVGCTNLKTVFNLSETLSISSGSSDYGKVALNAVRVASCTNHGTGENAIHQIPESFNLVNGETDQADEISEAIIPNNFIYKVNDAAKTATQWAAKKIVLEDDTCRFYSPVAFTADTAIYTRTFTDGNRSTLCLPFATNIPTDMEVYQFSGFNTSSNTLSFSPNTVGIEANTPYLVGYDLSKSTTTCTIKKADAVFPATPDPMTSVSDNNMSFQGTMKRTGDLPINCYGYSGGFFVQSGGYAHVNPFRCFFTYSGGQSNPATLIVDITEDDPLAIDQVEDPMSNNVRFSNDVYDLMGRLVRKNADNLRGLPQGIYIWHGKKNIVH